MLRCPGAVGEKGSYAEAQNLRLPPLSEAEYLILKVF